jgi:hypothetical protein
LIARVLGKEFIHLYAVIESYASLIYAKCRCITRCATPRPIAK